MAERDLTSGLARTVLVAAVAVLLSAALVNVLIAVTESVLWPVFVSAGYVAIAAGLVIGAEHATRSESNGPPFGGSFGVIGLSLAWRTQDEHADRDG
jgi:hypothetical protein